MRGAFQARAALNDSQIDEAENCFSEAVEITTQTGGKWRELRCATTLAEHWRDQGHIDNARDLLAPVVDWFTEGFECADLREAKAFLDELK